MVGSQPQNERCLESAKAVLEASSCVVPPSMSPHMYVDINFFGGEQCHEVPKTYLNFDPSGRIVNLVSSAVCIVFHAAVHDPSHSDGLPYLGMACGFLGMLAARKHPGLSVPFPEAMELLRGAQVVEASQRQGT